MYICIYVYVHDVYVSIREYVCVQYVQGMESEFAREQVFGACGIESICMYIHTYVCMCAYIRDGI